jgi:hypothetical protein
LLMASHLSEVLQVHKDPGIPLEDVWNIQQHGS